MKRSIFHHLSLVILTTLLTFSSKLSAELQISTRGPAFEVSLIYPGKAPENITISPKTAPMKNPLKRIDIPTRILMKRIRPFPKGPWHLYDIPAGTKNVKILGEDRGRQFPQLIVILTDYDGAKSLSCLLPRPGAPNYGCTLLPTVTSPTALPAIPPRRTEGEMMGLEKLPIIPKEAERKLLEEQLAETKRLKAIADKERQEALLVKERARREREQAEFAKKQTDEAKRLAEQLRQEELRKQEAERKAKAEAAKRIVTLETTPPEVGIPVPKVEEFPQRAELIAAEEIIPPAVGIPVPEPAPVVSPETIIKETLPTVKVTSPITGIPFSTEPGISPKKIVKEHHAVKIAPPAGGITAPRPLPAIPQKTITYEEPLAKPKKAEAIAPELETEKLRATAQEMMKAAKELATLQQQAKEEIIPPTVGIPVPKPAPVVSPKTIIKETLPTVMIAPPAVGIPVPTPIPTETPKKIVKEHRAVKIAPPAGGITAPRPLPAIPQKTIAIEEPLAKPKRAELIAPEIDVEKLRTTAQEMMKAVKEVATLQQDPGVQQLVTTNPGSQLLLEPLIVLDPSLATSPEQIPTIVNQITPAAMQTLQREQPQLMQQLATVNPQLVQQFANLVIAQELTGVFEAAKLAFFIDMQALANVTQIGISQGLIQISPDTLQRLENVMLALAQGLSRGQATQFISNEPLAPADLKALTRGSDASAGLALILGQNQQNFLALINSKDPELANQLTTLLQNARGRALLSGFQWYMQMRPQILSFIMNKLARTAGLNAAVQQQIMQYIQTPQATRLLQVARADILKNLIQQGLPLALEFSNAMQNPPVGTVTIQQITDVPSFAPIQRAITEVPTPAAILPTLGFPQPEVKPTVTPVPRPLISEEEKRARILEEAKRFGKDIKAVSEELEEVARQEEERKRKEAIKQEQRRLREGEELRKAREEYAELQKKEEAARTRQEAFEAWEKETKEAEEAGKRLQKIFAAGEPSQEKVAAWQESLEEHDRKIEQQKKRAAEYAAQLEKEREAYLEQQRKEREEIEREQEELQRLEREQRLRETKAERRKRQKTAQQIKKEKEERRRAWAMEQLERQQQEAAKRKAALEKAEAERLIKEQTAGKISQMIERARTEGEEQELLEKEREELEQREEELRTQRELQAEKEAIANELLEEVKQLKGEAEALVLPTAPKKPGPLERFRSFIRRKPAEAEVEMPSVNLLSRIANVFEKIQVQMIDAPLGSPQRDTLRNALILMTADDASWIMKTITFAILANVIPKTIEDILNSLQYLLTRAQLEQIAQNNFRKLAEAIYKLPAVKLNITAGFQRSVMVRNDAELQKEARTAIETNQQAWIRTLLDDRARWARKEPFEFTTMRPTEPVAPPPLTEEQPPVAEKTITITQNDVDELAQARKLAAQTEKELAEATKEGTDVIKIESKIAGLKSDEQKLQAKKEGEKQEALQEIGDVMRLPGVTPRTVAPDLVRQLVARSAVKPGASGQEIADALKRIAVASRPSPLIQAAKALETQREIQALIKKDPTASNLLPLIITFDPNLAQDPSRAVTAIDQLSSTALATLDRQHPELMPQLAAANPQLPAQLSNAVVATEFKGMFAGIHLAAQLDFDALLNILRRGIPGISQTTASRIESVLKEGKRLITAGQAAQLTDISPHAVPLLQASDANVALENVPVGVEILMQQITKFKQELSNPVAAILNEHYLLGLTEGFRLYSSVQPLVYESILNAPPVAEVMTEPERQGIYNIFESQSFNTMLQKQREIEFKDFIKRKTDTAQYLREYLRELTQYPEGTPVASIKAKEAREGIILKKEEEKERQYQPYKFPVAGVPGLMQRGWPGRQPEARPPWQTQPIITRTTLQRFYPSIFPQPTPRVQQPASPLRIPPALMQRGTTGTFPFFGAAPFRTGRVALPRGGVIFLPPKL